MIGKFLIYIALISSLISVIGFFGAHLGKEKYLKAGRFFYHISSIAIVAASFFLLYIILTHQFQYTYVWQQSNRDLQLPLLMSTFFAGQEGSFMLWTFMTAVIGVFLLNFVSKGKRLEPQVMTIFTLVLGFLSLILILKSPFNYVWESFLGEVKEGFIPQEGRGLNPLLQNYWMIIHPPVLFLGYASLAVPFSFAIAALIKNSYYKWVGFSLPWLLFSAATLGLGIILGGYWSYGVLGWGGYWAWDPVENSSLVPWIIAIAVIHTMLAQKRTDGYMKTNLILCILSFLFVLYSTFLTRSGILGDSSVHSFTDPGAEVYLALILFIGSQENQDSILG
jgi:cytochrome c-type biogenesis protein CcmF